MATLAEYAHRFQFVKLTREDGILLMRLHTDDGPMRWNLDVQAELGHVFHEIGADRENRVVILTGTGEEFSGPRLDPNAQFFHGAMLNPGGIHHVFANAKRLIDGHLNVEVPMIGVVNGPAKRHGDLALMCDIVLAADDASFEDTAHFHNGNIVPGDGINVLYTMLMGINRARYLMLTGQVLGAKEAKEIGLVAEVHPRAQLLPRAWELSRQLAQKPEMLLRYARAVLTHPMRRLLEEGMPYYLAMEALSTLDKRRD